MKIEVIKTFRIEYDEVELVAHINCLDKALKAEYDHRGKSPIWIKIKHNIDMLNKALNN